MNNLTPTPVKNLHWPSVAAGFVIGLFLFAVVAFVLGWWHAAGTP